MQSGTGDGRSCKREYCEDDGKLRATTRRAKKESRRPRRRDALIGAARAPSAAAHLPRDFQCLHSSMTIELDILLCLR